MQYYLDHNATSPVCGPARVAWLEAVERWPGNPSSPHRLGGRADRALQEAREELASGLACAAGDIIWTSGATESNNAVLHHCAQTSPGEAWISAVEHPSVVAPAQRWFAGRWRRIPVRRDGVIDLGGLATALREARVPPAVVAVMAANNETGVLQPCAEAAVLCREAGVPFLCDAAQWLGKHPVDELPRGCWLTGCAHKFGGTPGVGFLRRAEATRGFRPLLCGGPQEEGHRAGTENLPGIRAAVAALRHREADILRVPPSERAQVRDAFEARLLGEVPGVEVVGSGVPRLWNTSALLLPVQDCRRRWVVRLDREGYAVSTGSACSSGKEKPSPVLEAMGVEASGDRLIRVSSGWETPSADWDALATTLGTLARSGA